ncbi:hypothetical protein ACFV19_32985 [Streptomyces griseoluteus]|uniref:hypothetical protein n=1 Tax=Streptomyces griseoluteus TaxID=29306 RepID=UPI00368687D8
MTTHPPNGPLHDYFGLSYCNYAVLHRTLMQSMPLDWQERMTACLHELTEAYAHIEQPEIFEVKAATEHIVRELTDHQLKQARITESLYDEPVPEGLNLSDLGQWRTEHEKPQPTYYDDDGRELDPHERVLLPATDPVPHYNRGRTYIPPQL